MVEILCGFDLCSWLTKGLFLPLSVTLGQSSLLTGVCLGRSEVPLSISQTECTPEDWVHQKVFLYSSCLSVVTVFLTSYSFLVKLGDSVHSLPCLHAWGSERKKKIILLRVNATWENSICLPDLAFSTQFLSFSWWIIQLFPVIGAV